MGRHTTTVGAACAVALMLACAYPTTAGAQAGAVAADAAAKDVIADARRALMDILDKFGDTLNASSFKVRTDIQVLISELDNLQRTVLDKPFRELDKQQADLLRHIKAGTVAIGDEVARGTDRIDQVLARAEDLVANLPFTDDEPRVRRVAPRFVSAADTSPTVDIRIEGSYLAHGKSKASLGGKDCKVVEQLETSLAISCPRGVLQKGPGITRTVGVVEVRYQQSWIDAVKGVFTGEKPFKKYTLSIGAVPAKMGDYVVRVDRTDNRKVSATQTLGFSHNNDHCQRRTDHTANFGARQGWKIDSSSIRISGAGDGGHSGASNVSEAGFQVGFWVTNSGDCGPTIPFSDRRAFYDGRGHYGGSVSWTEWQIQPTPVNGEVVRSGPVEWGKEVTVPLPQGLVRVDVEIKMIDGTSYSIHGTEPKPYFDVELDGAKSAVTIKPKPLNQAISIASN